MEREPGCQTDSSKELMLEYTFTISMNRDAMNRLEQYAKMLGKSKVQIIRESVDAYTALERGGII